VTADAIGRSPLTRAACAFCMLRSPITASGSRVPVSERTSRRSWEPFHPGMNDRWVLQTVNWPNGPSRTAAIATRGSSRARKGRRVSGDHSGTLTRSGGSRTTRQDTTGNRESSATP
jgi:hypothetical protein